MATPRGALWRVLDERHPRGGRAKAWLFVTHPGPSLLVTAVTVAAAGLLTRQLPSPRTGLGLTLVVLPAQLGIGTLNDWADAGSDRAGKPFKPLVRGLVGQHEALVAAVGLFVLSLGAAAWLGPAVLGVDVLGVAAGVSYDLALKRSPLAVLAWWAGFVAVPLVAMVTTGRLRGGSETIPLALLLALALQLANGLPDAETDRLSGASTLPSVLGERASRWMMSLALVASAGLVLGLRARLGQNVLALLAAGLLAAGSAVGWLPGRRRALTFPLMAICVAAAAVCWLAALPASG